MAIRIAPFETELAVLVGIIGRKVHFIDTPQGNPRLQSREELRYDVGCRAYPYRRRAAQPNIGGLLAQVDGLEGRRGCESVRHDPATGVARHGNALGRELLFSCKAPACSGNAARSACFLE